jgi:hypothetical protein
LFIKGLLGKAGVIVTSLARQSEPFCGTLKRQSATAAARIPQKTTPVPAGSRSRNQSLMGDGRQIVGSMPQSAAKSRCGAMTTPPCNDGAT